MSANRRRWMCVLALLWAARTGFGRAQTLGSSEQMRDVPFQATQVVTRETASGTTATRGRMARDRAGSTYVEMVDPRTGVATTAFLLDVPGHRGVVLDLVHKRYSVRSAPELTSREPRSGAVPELIESAIESKGRSESETCNRSPCTVTHLGTRLVAGLMSVGTSEVWPSEPSMADRSVAERSVAERSLAERSPAERSVAERSPAARETERWFSVELRVLVRMTEVDRVRGQRTEVGLTEILRTEPNPALFLIPRDFRPDESSAGAPAIEKPGEPADGE